MESYKTRLIFSLLLVAMIGSIVLASSMYSALQEERGLRESESAAWAIKEIAYQERLTEVTNTLWDKQEENDRLSERIESMRFKPLDLPIPLDEQALTFAYSTMYDVPYNIPLFVGLNETGWNWMVDVMDTNGVPSTGFLMINQTAWGHLEEMGIDVHTKGGNIHGGIVLLSEHIKNSDSLEEALVKFECGATGAQGIESTEFSRKILRKAGLMDYE